MTNKQLKLWKSGQLIRWERKAKTWLVYNHVIGPGFPLESKEAQQLIKSLAKKFFKIDVSARGGNDFLNCMMNRG
jgi:hypothetical protein